MKATIEHRYQLAEQDEELAELILRVASWEEPPSLWLGGRTAVQLLDEPRTLGDRTLRALKFKGLGTAPLGDQRSKPPELETFFRRKLQRDHLHFGIVDGGRFALLESDPAPRGGITIARSFQECAMASYLYQFGVRAPVPVAVVSLPDLTYGDQNLGMAITGIGDPLPLRCSVATRVDDPAQDTTEAAYTRALVEALLDREVDDWGRDRVRLLAEVYRGFGRELRRFSEAGAYRYSGHVDNISFDFEEAAFELPDLDSSRYVEDLPEDLRALQVARDVMSGLFNLACRVVAPDQVHFSPWDAVEEVNPFVAFLGGYFHELDIDSVPLRPLVDHCRSVAELIAFAQELIYTDEADRGWKLFRAIRLDAEWTYAQAYLVAADLYNRSGLPKLYGPIADEPVLRGRLRDFGGEQFSQRLKPVR